MSRITICICGWHRMALAAFFALGGQGFTGLMEVDKDAHHHHVHPALLD